MNAGSYYSIGKSHTVCQDYARAGQAWNRDAFAALSDGCSSSPDSDVGARLLVLQAADNLKASHTLPVAKPWGEVALGAVRLIEPVLPEEVCDATLLIAQAGETALRVEAFGDGVIAVRLRSGATLVYDIDFGNAPAYLTYFLDASRLRGYLAAGCGKRVVRLYIDGQLDQTLETQVGVEESDQDSMGWRGFQFLLEFNSKDAEAVFLFSDGVHSFQHTETFEPIPMLDVVNRLMDIKSYTGAFVERRCKFFEHREVPKLKWQHTDDFSMAGIHTGD